VMMKRFILGFQRRVWCPKWTPLSRSWRMVTTAMPWSRSLSKVQLVSWPGDVPHPCRDCRNGTAGDAADLDRLRSVGRARARIRVAAPTAMRAGHTTRACHGTPVRATGPITRARLRWGHDLATGVQDAAVRHDDLRGDDPARAPARRGEPGAGVPRHRRPSRDAGGRRRGPADRPEPV